MVSDHVKISKAFDAFMADSGPNDKRDAIVIYRTQPDRIMPLASKDRGEMFELFGRTLAEVFLSIAEVYQKDAPELTTSPVGSPVLPVAQAEVTARTLRSLAEQQDVVAILPNQRLYPIEPTAIDYETASGAESKAGLTWGLEALGVPELWKTTKGEQIKVAVLDTGVHSDHRCLTGRVQKFVVIDPLGRRIEARPEFDSGQHGTHVCGTIAGGKTRNGISIGVAPQANLLVAGVLHGTPNLRTLIKGMSWAIQNGANIINMSFGFTYYDPKFFEIFKILINTYNVLPVVSIGNDNHGNTRSPGNASNALSVGAVEKANGRTDVAFFSSGASLEFPGQDIPLVTKPDVVAPGVRVYSCIPPEERLQGEVSEYAYMDGTSMASPHVAGVAALLMAAHPTANVSDIATVLKETAEHPGGHQSRPDNRWGYGMIRPEDALSALSS